MSEGKDDESLSIGDLDGVASGYVYDTGESVEVIDNEGNVVESFALNPVKNPLAMPVVHLAVPPLTRPL
jgi:hypothetical protein